MQFDYIIVGGGTAGCILADRLSASGVNNVLLIEAGSSPRSPFVRIPAGFTRLFKGPCDWDYLTVPQSCASDRQIYVPRGKMLGGSANMNALIHQWGHPADFDRWAADGATGWGWEDVYPTFRALELELTFETGANPHPVAKSFVSAFCSLNGPGASRYNGASYEGAWIAETATRNGKRQSVFHTHLKPALRRGNLSLMTDVTVDRILIKDGRAIGVCLAVGGDEQRIVFGQAGVILSAGAIESPAILMRSGIGNGEELKGLDIDTRVHSPHVGKHVQDHPMVVPTFGTLRADTYKSATSLPSLLSYLIRRRGPLASNIAEAIAFARSSPGLGGPDLELLFAPVEWRKEALAPPQIHAFSIGVAVVAPQSRGTISLVSRDPLVAPKVDFGLFSDPHGVDRDAMLAGIRLARIVAATPPLAAHLVREVAPGTDAQSDDALFGWICEEVQTVYHPSSSCRMGEAGRAVVSPRLAVHGVKGLWVADASVMPTLVRGHPNTTVAMIAARAAAFIVQDRN